MRSLLILLLFLGLNASAATVYRSVDANGNVIYTDRPDGRDMEQVVIRTAKASRSSQRPAPRKAASEPRADQEEAGSETEEGPSEEEVKAQREGNCKIAKNRLELYVTSRRLYKELPDGEREYLNDDQLTDARAKAADDVQKWCN